MNHSGTPSPFELEAQRDEARKRREEDHADAMENLKVEINTLLWTRLPPETTLAVAEGISCDLYERIAAEWSKALRAPPTPEGEPT